MPIFTHVTVGTNDLAKARAFYDAVLAPLGIKRLKDFGDGGSCWGFEAPSRAAVAAFHQAALAQGAKDEGAVGPRSFWPHAYAGYCRDLDGNKLAVYCRKAE
jgi:catechol 2,3-dioxygenase-like lactoylglutathione lyase family enzyme